MGSIKKIINSENGSMLLYSLLMVFVLTMLGVSVIGLSMSNFKMGRLASDKNKAFYASDAAVEHAMWVIDDETAKAEKKAREWADGEFASKLSGESISEENANAIVEAEFKRVYFGTLLGLDNLLDDSLLKYEPIYDDKGKKTGEKLDPSKTLEAYRGFEEDVLEDEPISASISDRIQNFKYESEFGEESGKLKKISMKSDYVISDTKDENGGSEPFDRITVSIESEGSYNKIRKPLEASLDITLPEYEYKNKSTNKSVLSSKTVMSRGDIVVTGGNVQVKGAMYTYGTYQETNKKYIGGIVVGYAENILKNLLEQNKYIAKDKIGTTMNLLKMNAKGNSSVMLHVQDVQDIKDTISGDISTRAEGPIINPGAKINLSGDIVVGTRDDDIFDRFDNEKVKETESIVFSNGKGQGKVTYIKTKDIYIYEGDKNKLYIREGDSAVSKELPNNIEGTIFTSGNIFITGNFSFDGSLIAGGNIFFYGEGVKHITYKRMNEYEKLSDFYIVNEDNQENTDTSGEAGKDESLKVKSYKVNYWREAK